MTNEELIERKIECLQNVIGSRVRGDIDIKKAPPCRIEPLATIYLVHKRKNGIQIAEFYKTREEVQKNEWIVFLGFAKVEYFGDISGCEDVIKITTDAESLEYGRREMSIIYSPTLEEYGFPKVIDKEEGKIFPVESYSAEYNLNKIYNKFKEMGMDIKIDYNTQNSTPNVLQKNKNEVRKNS